ncbi:MAG: Gldg family protein [Chitinophagaceae bacterium]|nr:Gldg family protein [Chitinophagaceae bacterium]
MKKIARITTIELATLFYSPIAWLVLIIFLIQCSSSYTDMLSGLLTLQELGGNYKQQLVFLTAQMFGYPNGMTYGITSNLYLYLPLLTMGLISRELSSGTIKLLYSSPVAVKDIVLGKFFAIAGYSLLLTLVYGAYLGLGTLHVDKPDIGLMCSILLGVWLLLCSYGAIGLFVSCLTSYQVVAAFSTFVVFAFLAYIGNVWQDIDFVRDVTYALSLAGRISNMGSGLITTKDLFYFGSVIYIFIGLSILKLNAIRSTDSRMLKAAKYFALIISGLTIGFVASRPTLIGYLDTTATKTRTLTKASQDIIKKMNDGELEVTSYINLLDYNYPYGQPASRNDDLERWLPYIRFKPDLNLRYEYYYDSVLRDPWFHKQFPDKSLDDIAANHMNSYRVRKGLFKKPAEMRKIINLRPEEYRYVMQLKYKGKTTFLRLFDDPLVFPSEKETGAALKRLTMKVPTIAFLQGELERSPTKAGDKDYRMMTSQLAFRYAMLNQGFDFTTVSLKDHDIPPDVSALVIADPKIAFDTCVLRKVNAFIDSGGNLLIAGEPGKQSVLNPLLEKLGIKMMDGTIVQKTQDHSPSLTLNFIGKDVAFSKALKKAVIDSNLISMPTVTALQYDSLPEFSVLPLVMTDERAAWRKKAALSSDSVQVNFTAAEGDERGKFATMVGLLRKLPNGKEQHIIVSADADFMSTLEMSRYLPGVNNFGFSTELFGWLSNGEFPVDVDRPEALDKKINLKGDDMPFLKLLLVWIIPAVMAVSAIVLLLRRKKQ